MTTACPDFLSIATPVFRKVLRQAFSKVLDVNYRPIYEVDVLDSINKQFLRDTFDLIWGLEIERVRYELPGRIFHELMPKSIRKMLAAFYTRPHAAEILAKLTINHSRDKLFDLKVCQAFGIPVAKGDLIQLYEVLVNEMVLIRGLTRD